MFEIPIILCTG